MSPPRSRRCLRLLPPRLVTRHSALSRFLCRRHCDRLIRRDLVGIARGVATSAATAICREGRRGEESRGEGMLLGELALLLSKKICPTPFALGVFPTENVLDRLSRCKNKGRATRDRGGKSERRKHTHIYTHALYIHTSRRTIKFDRDRKNVSSEWRD